MSVKEESSEPRQAKLVKWTAAQSDGVMCRKDNTYGDGEHRDNMNDDEYTDRKEDCAIDFVRVHAV